MDYLTVYVWVKVTRKTCICLRGMFQDVALGCVLCMFRDVSLMLDFNISLLRVRFRASLSLTRKTASPSLEMPRAKESPKKLSAENCSLLGSVACGTA